MGRPVIGKSTRTSRAVGPGLSSLNLAGRDIEVAGKAMFGGTTQFQLGADWPWITGGNHLGARLQAAHLDRYDSLNEFQEKSTEFTPRVQFTNDRPPWWTSRHSRAP